jgi:prefoldin alpha subunit
MAEIFNAANAPDRQRLALEAAYLRQQAEELNAQAQQLAQLLAENRAAQAGVDALPAAAASKEQSFAPLGAGVFAKTKPAGDSVVVEIGARVAREATPEEAKTLLAERAKAIEKALGEAQSALTATLRRMDELNSLAGN